MLDLSSFLGILSTILSAVNNFNRNSYKGRGFFQQTNDIPMGAKCAPHVALIHNHMKQSSHKSFSVRIE